MGMAWWIEKMNPNKIIKLTKQEKRELRLLVKRERAPYVDVIRAKIILLLHKGLSVIEICTKVGSVRSTVYKWKNRFIEERLEGLKDRPKSGRPAFFSPSGVNINHQTGL